MRKAKVILILIILFCIIYFLQTNFFSWFNIGGIMPNLFVILVLFIGLFVGNKVGGILGILFGVVLDLTIGHYVGVSSVFLALIGLLGEYFDKNFSKDSRATIIIMSAGSTVIYELGIYVSKILIMGVNAEFLTFTLTVLVEILFNVLLIIIIYPLIKKLGYYIEDAFKGKKILTRYF